MKHILADYTEGEREKKELREVFSLKRGLPVGDILKYRVRQRIGRFLSVKKIKSIGYHDTVTFIRKYIL